ncbi:MAG: pyridoxine 5'-phosphate synthase [Legionella sp.]|nr:pyridoxine 5'-phosphate synthase [Legionella sp.]
MTQELYLGVNIDHVATLRQARGTRYPDPVQAASLVEEAGADGVTLHMREDLRHIQARDVRLIKAVLQTRMNLELAVTEAMLSFAEEIQPEHVCLVPEKREELTTEGGLDVLSNFEAICKAVDRMSRIGSDVSIFIDPNCEQIEAAAATGASTIEIHTGCYANEAPGSEKQHLEWQRIKEAAEFANNLTMRVNAGHGLNYQNVKPIAAISIFHELNIGHAIVARALFCGMKEAVQHMRTLMREARYT